MPKKSGGALLHEGSFGCTYKPPLRCMSPSFIPESFPPDRVSKLSLTHDAQKEYRFKDVLTRIDPEQKYFIYPTTLCRPFIGDAKMKNACSIPKDPMLSKLLIMKDGGSVLNNGDDIPSNYVLFNILLQLFRGLKLLHANNIAHLDIKFNNVVCKEEPIENFTLRFIDFGLSTFTTDTNIENEDYSRNFLILPYELRLVNKSKKIDQNDLDKYYNKMRQYGDALPDWLIKEIPKTPQLYMYLDLQSKLTNGEITTSDIFKKTDVFSLGISLRRLILHRLKPYYKGDIEIECINQIIPLISQMIEPDFIKRISIDEATDMYEQALNRMNEIRLTPIFKRIDWYQTYFLPTYGKPVETLDDMEITPNHSLFDGIGKLFDGLEKLHSNNVVHLNINFETIASKLESGKYNFRFNDFSHSTLIIDAVKIYRDSVLENNVDYPFELRLAHPEFFSRSVESADLESYHNYLQSTFGELYPPKWLLDREYKILPISIYEEIQNKLIREPYETTNLLKKSDVFSLGWLLWKLFGQISTTIEKNSIEDRNMNQFTGLLKKMLYPDYRERLSIVQANKLYKEILAEIKKSTGAAAATIEEAEEEPKSKGNWSLRGCIGSLCTGRRKKGGRITRKKVHRRRSN